jgi:hypothetical protein
MTGSQGDWRLAGLEAGELVIQAMNADGKVLVTESILIEGDSQLDLDIPAGKINGWVLSRDSDEPIVGATVKLSSLTSPLISQTAADENGYFRIEDLGGGAYSLTASAAGRSSAEQQIELAVGGAEQVTLYLDQLQQLVLRISEVDGSIPTAIQVTPALAGKSLSTINIACDRTGDCVVEGLAPSDYSMLVGGSGVALIRTSFPGPATPVQLLARGTLTVTATVLPGEPVWRVRIIESGSAIQVPLQSWQDPDRSGWAPVTGGRLSFSLPGGSYMVEAFAPDANLHRQEIQVVAGEEARLPFPVGED